jgi:hypothetical protein
MSAWVRVRPLDLPDVEAVDTESVDTTLKGSGRASSGESGKGTWSGLSCSDIGCGVGKVKWKSPMLV